MPHLTARVPEAQLAGREAALITALTDAVVEVYGEWARDLVVVHLDGIPGGRWGVGALHRVLTALSEWRATLNKTANSYALEIAL